MTAGLSPDGADMLTHRSYRGFSMMGRLKPGVTVAEAQAEVDTMMRDLERAYPDTNQDTAGFVRKEMNRRLVGNGILLPSILMGLVLLVLLIACANVANLLLARGATREREIAIRMAVGGGRGRLVRQLLTESLLLSGIGAVLGVLFDEWGARLLVRSLDASLDLTLDVRVLAFTMAVAVLTSLLFGIVPAWRGTRVDPQSAMKANARGVIEGTKLRLGKARVTAQIALSLLLVVGAALMLSTFWKLVSLDAGFDRGHVLLVSADLRSGHYPMDRIGRCSSGCARFRVLVRPASPTSRRSATAVGLVK